MSSLKVLFVGVLLMPFYCQGQLQRILHQTLKVDSIQRIQINIPWDLTTKPWAGNQILMETEVKLFNAGANIFEFYVSKGRYRIATDTLEPGSLYLRLEDEERAPIQTSKGFCMEEVQLIIYLPDEFIPVGNGTWRLKGQPIVPVRQDSLSPARGNQ